MSLSKIALEKATKNIQKRWTLKKPLTKITKVNIKGKIKYIGNDVNWEFNEDYLKFKSKL